MSRPLIIFLQLAGLITIIYSAGEVPGMIMGIALVVIGGIGYRNRNN